MESGVSYSNYDNLIQPFLTEVSIIKDIALSTDDKLLAETYVDAAEIFTSAKLLWSSVVKNGNDVTGGMIPDSFFNARKILDKANEALPPKLSS